MPLAEMREPHWVLAFDSSCSTCNRLSRAVADSSEQRLDVVPLLHPDVRAWREKFYGDNPPWEPTLLKVSDGGTSVRAWTGRSMAFRLVGVIGARASVRILRALGELQERQTANSRQTAQPGQVTRKRFLGQVAAGSLAAGGLVLLGKLPVAAAAPDDADAWVQSNLSNLPKTYDALGPYDEAHRRAIFRALPPQAKSRIWAEQLTRYRDEQGNRLTSEQSAVLDQTIKFVENPSTFADSMSDTARSKGAELEAAALAAFGRDTARAVFVTIGPR